jgi:hypothetical protein
MTPELKFTGTIKEIFDTVQVSDKFKKREFVITDNNAQYPQLIKFELAQDKCSLIDGNQKGNEVEVYFNLRGREWANKDGVVNYFNQLQCWKVVTLSNVVIPLEKPAEIWHETTSTPKSAVSSMLEDKKNNPTQLMEDDGLPF